MSQDPIGLTGGMNLFEYAPNPIIWVDPLGLSSFSCNKLTVCGCKEILKSENVIIGKHGDMKKNWRIERFTSYLSRCSRSKHS